VLIKNKLNISFRQTSLAQSKRFHGNQMQALYQSIFHKLKMAFKRNQLNLVTMTFDVSNKKSELK
jgi:hypothetical protein